MQEAKLCSNSISFHSSSLFFGICTRPQSRLSCDLQKKKKETILKLKQQCDHEPSQLSDYARARGRQWSHFNKC